MLFMLKPDLYVELLVLGFAFVGALGGFAYGLASRKNILYIVLFMLAGAIGFGIGSLISPVIGNLIGTAFDSLLVAYLVTFSIIGAIPGALFGTSMYLADKKTVGPGIYGLKIVITTPVVSLETRGMSWIFTRGRPGVVSWGNGTSGLEKMVLPPL